MPLSLLAKIAESTAPRHYFALLGSVLGLTVLAPLLEHIIWARLAVGGMLFAALLTASLAVKSDTKITGLIVFLAVLSGLTWVLALVEHMAPFNTAGFQIITNTITLSFFAITAFIILQDVFSGTISSNKICGAVCVYLIIGFCCAIVHMNVALLDPDAYRNNTAVTGRSPEISTNHAWLSHYPLFVYFSFCTLSTVGYGDIIPMSRLARSISCMEAIMGQLYLAVLIARLVGLHTANLSMRYGRNFISSNEEKNLIRENSSDN
jgi:hypothetical protein